MYDDYDKLIKSITENFEINQIIFFATREKKWLINSSLNLLTYIVMLDYLCNVGNINSKRVCAVFSK